MNKRVVIAWQLAERDRVPIKHGPFPKAWVAPGLSFDPPGIRRAGAWRMIHRQEAARQSSSPGFLVVRCHGETKCGSQGRTMTQSHHG